jgi:hypothetical protein
MPTISYISAPIVGAVIRNSPTTVRKARGFYTINATTEPNWTVELYINNVLVDYTKADASGSYQFKVPMVYGYTILKLKFYGPMGEERTEERTMNVPYTVMPAGEFEYSLSAGIVEDSSTSRFGKAEVNYGVNRYLTVGSGLEYLSSVSNGPFIPYATATIQPFGKLILNGEYDHGVKARALLDYYFWKDALLEIDYSKYQKGQLATPFFAPEERKVRLSVPLRINRFSGFAKVDFSELVYNTFNYYQTSIMLSAYYKQFSANSSTEFNWIDQKTTYVTTDLALSYRFGKGYTIRGAGQYNVNENRFMTWGGEIDKNFPNGNLSFSYERNVYSNDNIITVGIRYDLPFARTSIAGSRSNNNFTVCEAAQGSLAFGSGNNNIHTNNNTSISRGGISLFPFLDLNGNGIFDKGEPMVKLTTVKIMGSNPVFSTQDSIVRIPDLNPFVSYTVEFSDNDLENIAWRFKKKIYSVLIDPNQYKRVDVPIIVVGEVTGRISMNKEDALKGIGRILVSVCQKNSDKPFVRILSESDGYIDFLGLPPGEYTASIDPAQLSTLELTADPPQREFTIKTSVQGDIVSGMDFTLTRK